MMITDLTGRIILQGRALVRAIEALSIIEPAGLAETARARGGKDRGSKSPPAIEVGVGVLLLCEAMHSSTELVSALVAYQPRRYAASGNLRVFK